MKTLSITFQLVLLQIFIKQLLCAPYMLCAEDRDVEAYPLSSDCLQVVFSVIVYRDFGKVLWGIGSKFQKNLSPQDGGG